MSYLAYRIRRHAGKPVAQIAAILGVSRRHLYRLAQRDPTIAEALELARDAALARTERLARELLWADDLSHVKTQRTRRKHNKANHRTRYKYLKDIERAYRDSL